MLRIDLADLMYALSFALDAVEEQVAGVTKAHGKRVAYLSMRMLRSTGVGDAELLDDVAAFLMHDNALGGTYSDEVEMITEEVETGRPSAISESFGDHHWTVGERNFHKLPLRTKPWNIILWHHENADGSGPLGLTQKETNLASQLLHMTAFLDIAMDLRQVDAAQYTRICQFVRSHKGTFFSDEAVDLFLSEITLPVFEKMDSKGPEECLRQELPSIMGYYTSDEIREIAEFFASIVDCRSSFTKSHSMAVARTAERMARYYQWPEDKVTRYYFAGALHDIGKLIVPNDILEKTGRLNREEYDHMKDHAAATLFVMKRIKGLEDNVAEWAGNHHEKLDGSGYPRGLTAKDLTFEDRLMCCADIYVALREQRPYKNGVSHAKAIKIMRSMVNDGKIDAGITEDFAQVFADGSEAAVQENKDILRWKCPVCGYIYEGDFPPERCPICGEDGSEMLRTN